MALITYPLNDVDYSAEDAELFHCTRSSGIYASNHFGYSINGADSKITVGAGIGWIKNGEFSGKVIAQKGAVTLDMGLSDTVYPRIDAVVIQFDSNANETNVVVKKGTAASTPAAPEVVRTEALYELHLFHVKRAAGSAYITASDITDLRLDANYCGLMAESVTQIDTTLINAQVKALISKLESEIQKVVAGGIPDHTHSADDLNEGVLSMEHGGTGSDGSNAMKNLLAAGYMQLSPKQYGPTFPTDAPDGTLFFIPLEAVSS